MWMSITMDGKFVCHGFISELSGVENFLKYTLCIDTIDWSRIKITLEKDN
ncbi:hypothetical protein [Bacillus pseudomycoides]|nr:hypothetical protein [Bacillus pseudomycoides]